MDVDLSCWLWGGEARGKVLGVACGDVGAGDLVSIRSFCGSVVSVAAFWVDCLRAAGCDCLGSDVIVGLGIVLRVCGAS